MEPLKHVLLFFWLVLLLFPVKLETPVSCTAGRYTEGTTASIICHFPTIVQITPNQGVYVEQNKAKEVLKCQSSNQGIICDVATGFYFNKDFSDTLILLIPKVTHHFEGSYFCQRFPLTDGTTPLPCKLTIDDIVTVSTEGSVAIPTDNSGQICPEKEDRPEANLPLYIVVTALATCILTALPMALLMWACLNRRSNTSPTGTQNDDESLIRSGAGQQGEIRLNARRVIISQSVDVLESPIICPDM